MGKLPATPNKAKCKSSVNQWLILLLCFLSYQMLCFPVSSGQRKIRTLESSGRRKERRWRLCTLITNLLVSDDIRSFPAFLCLLQTEKKLFFAAFLSSIPSLLPLIFYLKLRKVCQSQHLSITFHYRVLCRTCKDRRSDTDDTLRYSERLGGIPLWGDCQRGPCQPWRGHCNPQCAWYDGKPNQIFGKFLPPEKQQHTSYYECCSPHFLVKCGLYAWCT